MTVINTEIAETVEITSNGMHDVAKYTSANVAVPKVINSLNVTPTTSAQQITATGGVDGYSPVNVSAVTSSIDANITAGNIKKDVQILGVTGTYEGGAPQYCRYFSVDDGALRHWNTTAPMFDFTGVSSLQIDKAFASAWYMNTALSGTISFADLEYIGGQEVFSSAFNSCTGITAVDMSTVEEVEWGSCSYMFAYCTNLASIDFSSLHAIGDQAFEGFIQMTAITSLSFPAMTTRQDVFPWGLYNMLDATDGITLHFPTNMQASIEAQEGYPHFGGSNVTVLFDLPATE